MPSVDIFTLIFYMLLKNNFKKKISQKNEKKHSKCLVLNKKHSIFEYEN